MVGEFGGIGAFVEGREWVANKCSTYDLAARFRSQRASAVLTTLLAALVCPTGTCT